MFLGLVAIGQRCGCASRNAGGDFGKRAPLADQRAARGEIAGLDQPRDRYRNVIAIRQVKFAIGIGEPLRFDEQMPGCGIAQAQRGKVEPFELAEHL